MIFQGMIDVQVFSLSIRSHGRRISSSGGGQTIRYFLRLASTSREFRIRCFPEKGKRMPSEYILIVSRDNTVRRIVAAALAAVGYRCSQVRSTAKARSLLGSTNRFHLVLWDVSGAETNGFRQLTAVFTLPPRTPIVVMTAVGDIPLVLETIGSGAYDYLLKPFEREQLLATVHRALQNRHLQMENRALRTKLASIGKVDNAPDIISESRILVVDDEEPIRQIVVSMLQSANYSCTEAASGLEALAVLSSEGAYDLMLSDLMMADLDGIGLLNITRSAYPDMPTVMVTAVHDLSVALAAIRIGAYDYLLKPFEREQLLATVRRALQHERLKKENHNYREILDRLGQHVSDSTVDGIEQSTDIVPRQDLDSQQAEVAPAATATSSSAIHSSYHTNPDARQKRATVLSILHDLSNEFMAMSASVDSFSAQPGLTADIAKENDTLRVQLNRCTSILRAVLNDPGFRLTSNAIGVQHATRDISGLLRDATHEINGSLFLFCHSLTMLRTLCKASPSRIADLQKLRGGALRCDELMEQTSLEEDESSTVSGEASLLDMRALVERTLAIVGGRLTPNVTLVVDCDEGIVYSIKALPPERLISILVEIITNSINALQPRGGSISLCTRKANNNTIKFVVQDDGPGIPSEIRFKMLRHPVESRIGLGLGLYLSATIVRQHGGTLRVSPGASGKGTRVTILLPFQKGSR